MRARRLIICSAAGAVAALVVMLIRTSHGWLAPPVVRLASIEPAGIMDDEGAEMWLATVGISNANPQLSGPAGVLFVKNDDRLSEVKSGETWSEVERPWVEGQMRTQIRTCELSPGVERQRLLLLPANTRSCRIVFKYVGGVISYRTRLAHLVQRMPLFIRSRVSFRFWRWVGFDHAYPGSDWRDVSVELPFAVAKAN